jgi:putative endonuclease
MKLYYVYLLKCKDSAYYVGITSDLERRLMEHNMGKYPNAFTYSRRLVELVWFQDFVEPHQAIAFEKRIKKWSRAKKEAVISGNWDVLTELAACKNLTHYKFNPDLLES